MDEKYSWAKTSPFQPTETNVRVSGIVSMILLQKLLSVGSNWQIGRFLLAFMLSSVYHTMEMHVKQQKEWNA